MTEEDPQVEDAETKTKQEGWEDTGHFAAYREYNRVLRTWFVAFGIGGPALILVNQAVAKRLAETHQLELVATAFLIGAAAQVLGAVLNKTANWYVYRGTLDPEQESTRWFKIYCWILDQYWFDVALDCLTIGSFGVAVWKLLVVFAKSC